MDKVIMNKLCVHDWVGDDDCQYCLVDELRQALFTAINAKEKAEIIASQAHQETYRKALLDLARTYSND